MEPPGAPEIGRRPLDLEAGRPIPAQNERALAQPMLLRREALIYEDHYWAAATPRMPGRGGMPAPPRLAKLDTFKGENGEKLGDFVYQVEEFASFHAWDQIETCRQPRTHLKGVALAYIRRVHLPP